MVKFAFRGLMPAVLSPFKPDFSVNLEVISKYADFLAQKKFKGLMVNGTTGEGMSLSISERKQVAEAWVKAASKHNMHVMVQVGGVPLPEVIDLVKHAVSLKVNSLLMLPELYNKPKSVKELVDYVEEVAKHAPTTPLIYYHYPGMTSVTVNMPAFINAAKERIPNFCGIKYSSTDLVQGTECLKAAGSDLVVFLGAHQILVGAAVQGFNCSIGSTYSAIPQYSQDIWSAVAKGDLNAGKKSQHDLNELLSDVSQEGACWVAIIKAVMATLTPVDPGLPRSPLKPMTEAQMQRVKDALKKHGLLTL